MTTTSFSKNSELSNLRYLLKGTKWEMWNAALCAKEASSRSYWRLTNPKESSSTVVAAICPPKLENLNSFLSIASLLEHSGTYPPRIFYKDLQKGILILEDLGNNTYRQVIESNKEKLTELYELFNDTICHLHKNFKKPSPKELKECTEETLWQEVENLFLTWYLPNTKCPSLSSIAKEELRSIHKDMIQKAFEVPFSLSLRDAIVDNFMVRPQETGLKKCAILDFQDAFWAPVTYDLASMYRDARFDLSESLVQQLLKKYLEKNPQINHKKFYHSFNIICAQRNIKVLGTFTRLAYRDNKTKYLKHIAQAWKWLEKSLEDPCLLPLKNWISKYINPRFRKLPSKPLNKKNKIHQAMILCAGFGKRLSPLTDTLPKSLIPIGNSTALGWIIEKLREQAITKIVINTHHLSKKIETYIKNYDHGHIEFIFSHEDTILDTGGGIYNALKHFNNEPFFALNTDILWSGNIDPLQSLAQNYNPKMQALLGLADPINFQNVNGDYLLDQEHRPYRIKKKNSCVKKGYVFTGIRILHPNIFTSLQISNPSFSILKAFDTAEQERSLYAHIYSPNITWWDIGSLPHLEKTQKFFDHHVKNQNTHV